VKLKRGDEITPVAVRWLWKGWLAAGKFHILAGNPGTGKTTVALAFAAAVTRGAEWPDGTRAFPGDVVIWSGEDDPTDTLAPRLMAMGADMKRIHFVDNDQGSFDPARDMGKLQQEAASVGSVRLLIVDPVVSAVNSDSHKNAETRRSLQPLVDLAAVLDCAVLGIHHLSKGTSGREPIERVTGSIAFGALARVVMVAAKLPPDHERSASRILAIAKSYIGQDAGGFGYGLEQIELGEFPGVSGSAVVWKGAIEGTARELLAEAEPTLPPEMQGEPRDQSMTDNAIEFLRHVLAVTSLLSKDVKSMAAGEGISEKALRTARERLAVDTCRVGFGPDTKSYWTLPRSAAEIEQFLAEGIAQVPALVPTNRVHAPQMEVGTNGAEGTNDETAECGTEEF
jgi:putative DNA primase/helicase